MLKERFDQGISIMIKKEITKTSQLGTKQGETRATFIVSEELLEEIKSVAYWDRVTIKDIVCNALREFLEKKRSIINNDELNKFSKSIELELTSVLDESTSALVEDNEYIEKFIPYIRLQSFLLFYINNVSYFVNHIDESITKEHSIDKKIQYLDEIIEKIRESIINIIKDLE